MSGEFTAFPVGQGDAFFLRRDNGTTILVDGGSSLIGLSSQLSALFPSQSIDVVVCTHADKDHCEGLIGLLEQAIHTVKEVWLPGRWLDRLEDLCKHGCDFLTELAKNIMESDCREFGKAITDGTEDIPREPECEQSFANIEDALESDDDSSCWCDACCVFDTFILFSNRFPHKSHVKSWSAAVNTAKRIKRLTMAAHHHGAQIRWFDFEEYQRQKAPSGGESFLQPMNAVELTQQVVRKKLSALRFVELTLDNRESLVFLAPETKQDSSVLFTSDSNLKFCFSVGSLQRIMLATAPHHGSEDNAPAYTYIATAIAKVQKPNRTYWVRSDGCYKIRPGATYLAQQKRVCTWCRGTSLSKQRVQLTDVPSWQLKAGIQGCHCERRITQQDSVLT